MSAARAQRACAKVPARKRGAMVSASAAVSADQPEPVASRFAKNLKVRCGLAHRLEAGLAPINQHRVVQPNIS